MNSGVCITDGSIGEIRSKKIDSNNEIWYLMITPDDKDKINPKWIHIKDVENKYHFIQNQYESIFKRPSPQWIWDYYNGKDWVNFSSENTSCLENNLKCNNNHFNITNDNCIINLKDMFMVKDYKLYVIRRRYKWWVAYCFGCYVPHDE